MLSLGSPRVANQRATRERTATERSPQRSFSRSTSFVDLVRERLFDADVLKPSEVHSFKELMADYADVMPDNWYMGAFEELDAQGHIGVEANAMGLDAHARLSADGRLYVRQQREG